jgi:hypothetical protein
MLSAQLLTGCAVAYRYRQSMLTVQVSENNMTTQKKKQISRPNVVDKLTLDTEVAQRVYERTFPEVLRNVYSLSIVARIVSENQSSTDELNDLVAEKFKGMSELMDNEMERLKKLRDDNAITASLKYSNPLILEVEVSSPMASHYLQLIKKLDSIVKLLDCLWLAEELDAKQKLRGEYEWQRRIIKLANQVRDAYNRSRSPNKPTNEVGEADTKSLSTEPAVDKKDESLKPEAKKTNSKTAPPSVIDNMERATA